MSQRTSLKYFSSEEIVVRREDLVLLVASSPLWQQLKNKTDAVERKETGSLFGDLWLCGVCCQVPG